jgi:hypothetical protein
MSWRSHVAYGNIKDLSDTPDKDNVQLNSSVNTKTSFDDYSDTPKNYKDTISQVPKLRWGIHKL